eukprot:TRINITY_DN9063_c0_g1_i7.p1 TRINITY_DN9063_c0_g1~~TRINITY_DN9063_c0_g1_i7.p1  ORF type:complete len:695 (+),score=88.49 TRINITY_DN9063_c0_g1_i7:64-2148(+)
MSFQPGDSASELLQQTQDVNDTSVISNNTRVTNVDSVGEKHANGVAQADRSAPNGDGDVSGSPEYYLEDDPLERSVEEAPEREDCLCGLKYGSAPHHIMPYPPRRYRSELRQVAKEVLAGITTSFAQVPGSIAFAAIAGVDPLLGLHPAWIIGFFTSAFGSRPGMINGATGVRAATVAPFIEEHGVGMLFWIVLMISVWQFLFALLSLPRFIKLVPRPAMIGFANGLAIIIFLGQFYAFRHDCGPDSSLETPCPEGVQDDDWRSGAELGWMIFQVFLTLLGCVLGAKFVKGLPPSMIGIVVSIFFEWAILRQVGYSTPTIGETSRVDGGLPKFFWTDSQYSSDDIPPLNGDTFVTTLWPAFIAAAAGAVEAVMTMEVVNDITETTNPAPNQQLYALSAGNFVSGLFGTMGGGATIGESILNCMNGANGHYRISGIVASFMMFLYILVAGRAIEQIPTTSLVGVMFLIAFTAFEWESLLMILGAALPKQWREGEFMSRYTIRKITRIDALCIILVVVVTLLMDLFTGVAAGIVLVSVAYCWQTGLGIQAHTQTLRDKSTGQAVKRIYRIDGPLFFSSALRFPDLFRYKEDPPVVEAHFDNPTTDLYDFSALHALNVVGEKYKKLNKEFHVKKLSPTSLKVLTKADDLVRHFVYTVQEEEDPEEVPLTTPFRNHVAQQAYNQKETSPTLRRRESFV